MDIRKEFSDYWSREKGGVMKSLQEFRDSFKVREEDIYIDFQKELLKFIT